MIWWYPILALLWGMSDRWAGSNFCAVTRAPGRPLYYATPFLALSMGLVSSHTGHDWWGALLGAAFMLWRVDGWHSRWLGGIGGIDPESWRDRLGLFLRHLYMLPVVSVCVPMHTDWQIALLAVVLWAFASMLLGSLLGLEDESHRARGIPLPPIYNDVVEFTRGAAFCFPAAIILGLA